MPFQPLESSPFSMFKYCFVLEMTYSIISAVTLCDLMGANARSVQSTSGMSCCRLESSKQSIQSNCNTTLIPQAPMQM